MLFRILAAGFLPLLCHAVDDVFPAAEWRRAAPEAMGMDAAILKKYAQRMKGDGCIVRHGRMVYQWGDITSHRDWASASKPMFSTLLFHAIKSRLVASVHQPIATLGWPLEGKDRAITFQHLACMTSGYACPEPPGSAWGYNDLGIQLFAMSLEKVFGGPLEAAAQHCLAPLQLQDGQIFGSRDGRGVTLSPRDMARVGLLWLNEGRWERREVLPRRLFALNLRQGTPAGLPRTTGRGHGHDYLHIGSYGGSVNQTHAGPGFYSFCFWLNSTLESGRRVWPSAPSDMFQANGAWNSHTVTMIPSLHLVVVVSNSRRPGGFSPGKTGAADDNMKILMSALLTGLPSPKKQ